MCNLHTLIDATAGDTIEVRVANTTAARGTVVA